MKTQIFAILLPACLAMTPAARAGEILTAFDVTNNRLISFDSTAPGVFLSSSAFTGLSAGDGLVGFDYRPANGQLYGVVRNSVTGERVVTIDTATGAITTVGGGVVSLDSAGFFGVDFNPVVDRMREVNSNGNGSRRLNPNDGAIVGTDANLLYFSGDPNFGVEPTVSQVAYTNNFAGAVTTTLYGIDTSQFVLTILNSPNSGILNTVGSLGVFPSDGSGGFDISGATGVAYAALRVGGASNLYTINLSTGAATLVGQIGPAGVGTIAIDGLSVQPSVPEPATVMLTGLVLLALVFKGVRKS